MPLYERLTTTNKVLLYIPNLIDYLRAILMFISFLFMEKRPVLFLFLYAACAFLDALDGYFARKYRQTSRVGSLLDLLIDMMATTCLVMYLATTESFKKYTFLLQIWVFFTITGHWAHQYASILRGDVSHKSNDENRSIVLRLYYKTRWGLALLVMMNEVFFMGLYVQDSFGSDKWYVDNQFYSQCSTYTATSATATTSSRGIRRGSRLPSKRSIRSQTLEEVTKDVQSRMSTWRSSRWRR